MAGVGGMMDPFTLGLLLTTLANNPQLGQQIGLDPSQALSGGGGQDTLVGGMGMGPAAAQLAQANPPSVGPGGIGGDARFPLAGALPGEAGRDNVAAPAMVPGMGGPTAASAGESLPWAGSSAGPTKVGYNPGLQGVKAPAPIQPIMSGGVTGGVRAPEMTAKMGNGSAAIQALMAALLGGPAPERVGTLGSYVRPPGR